MGALLLALASPIAIQVLATLGLGVVTYTGFSAILTMVHTSISSSFSGLAPDMYNLVLLSGIPTGMGIMLSAISARIGLMQVKKIQLLK
jgi:hypothetical protein